MPPSASLRDDERLAALRRYDLLDTLPEQVYDDLARLAAHVCQTPIALVSLIETDRQWFKARIGLDAEETDIEHSFCAHAIAEGELLVIPNATLDERFRDNPLVTGPPDIRFYAGTPLLSRDGHALGTLCVIDREPRQLGEQQLEMLRILGRQVMSQIELRLHIAERARIERAMSEFVSIVSHELRTPLTSLRGSLGLIDGGVAGELPPQMAQLMGIARSNTDRLVRLVNDMLDLTRIEAGRLDLQLRPLDPEDLVESAFAEIRGLAEQAKVRLTDSADPGRRPVLADRDRMVQVLINLLSNAIKASPPGSVVEAFVGPAADGRIRMEVRDEGPGIPGTEIRRIFEKFQQLDRDSGRGRGGTGLGLTISKAIVEQHGGSIGVESELGRGSTFWFDLPVCPPGPDVH
jgi:signal transduction histidine kinase